MKKLLASLALLVASALPSSAQNYQATAGSGLTFGAKLVGGILFPQQMLCDPTTPAQCVAVNASGQITITNTTFASTQSGTWTVQPGNTANTTAWLVTGTGGTFPATQSGTWNITNVSGTVSLPTGASTAANQTTIIGHLDGVETLITSTNTKLDTLNSNVTSPVASGTNIIGRVGIDQTTPGTTNAVATFNGGSTYETVAASQTGQILGSAGAIGDYLSHCVIYPATTSPGPVTVFDDASAAGTNVIAFPGGASSVSSLVPISILVGAVSVTGEWRVTTGANVIVTCYGKFT